MSSFAAKDFNANRYANLRPTYPKKFYEILSAYHQGPKELVVDVGCGPGTATFQLAEHLSFNKIIGTDFSTAMIESAEERRKKDTVKYKKMMFQQSPGESFGFLAEKANKQKCDMITAVECVHYFDIDAFQKAVAANLRKDGTISIWGYGDFFFPNFPKLNVELEQLIFSNNMLGPFWKQPGRMLASTMLKDVHFDERWFKDIEEVYFEEKDLKDKNPDSVPLYLSERLPFCILKEYLKTWSAYHSWKTAHPFPQEDVIDLFEKRAKALYPELNDNSELRITWNTFWMFARRK